MDRLEQSTVIACEGFRVGESIVPSFEVGPGEIVKIVFPSRHSKDMHLAAQRIRSHFPRDGRASIVELPMPPFWLREVIHRQTAAEWLIERCGMNRQDAVEQLNRVQVNPDHPLSQLAGNPRWMIGFVAAMHQRPAALVFTTTGCDPLGMQLALAAVSEQLQDSAAVYLSCFSDLKIAEPDYAAVLNTTSNEREPVA